MLHFIVTINYKVSIKSRGWIFVIKLYQNGFAYNKLTTIIESTAV